MPVLASWAIIRFSNDLYRIWLEIALLPGGQAGARAKSDATFWQPFTHTLETSS